MSISKPPIGQESIIAALKDPDRYPHTVDTVVHLETHISHIFLAGKFAYKIKKPLDLGFLNFQTLERREFYCHEEVRLNRRLAAEWYLEVVPICGSPADPVIGGPTEEAIEFAVLMRRFPQNRQMNRLLAEGLVEPHQIDAIANRMAPFHEHAARPDGAHLGAPYSILELARENFCQLRPHLAEPWAVADLHRLESWTEAEFEARATTMAARREDGSVRECHGDLHAGNIALLDQGPLIFDCIEFDANLRWTDVQSDVAFLAMDLMSSGHPQFAWRFVNRYLERTGDFDGLRVLRFYLVYRAMVRAKITGIRASQTSGGESAAATADCSRYLKLATRLSSPSRPFLAIAHGFSGSGKSVVASLLAEALGAVQVRSDIERKRLAGLAFHQRSRSGLDRGIYSGANREATYTRLFEIAEICLDSGFPTILDATFLCRRWRLGAQAIAERYRTPFFILTATAPIDILRKWLRERASLGRDPSEADEQVLERQLTTAEPLDDDERGREMVFRTAGALDHESVCAIFNGKASEPSHANLDKPEY